MNQADTQPLVAHVIHQLATGGLENGLVNLINQMPASAFRHVIICIEDFSGFRARIIRDDVEVIAMHRSEVGVWRMRAALFRLFRRLRPAIVHSRNLSGLDALLPARLAGVRVCLHGEHGWDVGDLRGERRLWLRRLHMPLVTRYVTVSRDLQRYLVERVGVPERRVTQIYNGVDSARFAPGDASPDVFPPRFLAPDKLVVGTVGRAQAIKDQISLIRACARLRRDDPEMRERLLLAIVGDGPMLAALRTEADTLGLGDAVWLPGNIADIPGVLRGLDVFVLPSLMEGISNTLLEAMATGLPVIATAVGGNVELVARDVEGRLFEAQDVDTLARLIAAYLADPALRLRTGRAARERVLREFSLPAMVGCYQKLYLDAIGADRVTTP